jgi:hypothetical protein
VEEKEEVPLLVLGSIREEGQRVEQVKSENLRKIENLLKKKNELVLEGQRVGNL